MHQLHTLPQKEAFFDETIAGWATRMRAAGLLSTTIIVKCRAVRRFRASLERYTWECGHAHIDAYGATMAGRYAPATVRNYIGFLKDYYGYVSDPAYDWSARCRALFGVPFRQICVPENTLPHVSPDGDPSRRSLTTAELERLFSAIRKGMERAGAVHRKGRLTAARDYALLATALGWGLRARELARLELFDLREAADHRLKARYGSCGVIDVRWGKSNARGRPRRRQVLSVPLFEFSIRALQWYVDQIRPQFNPRPAKQSALWLTERGTQCRSTYVSGRFAFWRRRARLSPELSLHCLRHTYVTKLLEDGYAEQFVQDQCGHSDASITAGYTSVGNDFKRRIVMEALSRLSEPCTGASLG